MFHRDLEVWWVVREREEATPSLLLLALGGRREFPGTCLEVAMAVYRRHLEGRGEGARLVTMLAATEDLREGMGGLGEGNKARLAAAIAEVVEGAGLAREDVLVEVELLRPSWLGTMVMARLLHLPSSSLGGVGALVEEVQWRWGEADMVEVLLYRTIALHTW